MSKTAYCNRGSDCADGLCEATQWWTSCDGRGSCRLSNDNTDALRETVKAGADASLTSNCATNGTARCDNTKQCGVDALYNGHHCDGAGACTMPTGAVSCGSYSCDTAGPQCKTQCSTHADCAQGQVCSASICHWSWEWVRWDVTKPKIYTYTTSTVTDNQTGLMWQRGYSDTTRHWGDAMSDCDVLSLAGYTDWRLPTLIELRSIVDTSRSNPAINMEAFSGTPSVGFWTSTPYFTPGYAWYVSFNVGNAKYDDTSVTDYWVRCVR